MHSILSRTARAGSLSLALLGLLGAVVQTASAAESSAWGVSAVFTADGIRTAINPVNRLTGGATSSTYDRAANSGRYRKTLVVAAGATPVPALTVAATNLRSHVQGAFGVDTISAEGDATAAGLVIDLQIYPLPPDPVPEPFLLITVTRLRESGSYNFVAPKLASVKAGAAVSGLAIGGTLLHGESLQYSGTPAANHVLFQSPTMTITLNHQISTNLISCSPKCAVTPVSIGASALEITLTNAYLHGHKVSGQIEIGAVEAGRELPF